MIERTLILLKPDAVQRNLIGEIISRFEKVGMKFIGMKMVWVDKDFAKKHYKAHVEKEFYPDPTTTDSRWVVVNLKPSKPLSTPVTLDSIKKTPALRNIALLKQSRLSVMPLTKKEFKTILKMGQSDEKNI